MTVTAPPERLGGTPVETTGALLHEGADRLVIAGSESPRLDAELLLGHALGVGRTVVLAHPEEPVGVDAARRYRADLELRAAGEPVAYLRGIKEFYGLAFQVDRRALIPRPETERLVELAEAEVRGRLGAAARDAGSPPLRIVDVGTGSGAIAVALAVSLRRFCAMAEVEILAVDISSDALDLARANALAHAVADRVEFADADLLPPGVGELDLIVANLPYVRRTAMNDLPRATTFEPAQALDGGSGGLEIMGRLLERLPDVLAEGGTTFLEIGFDQAEEIVQLVAERLPGWRCDVATDLAGLPRVARIWRPQA